MLVSRHDKQEVRRGRDHRGPGHVSGRRRTPGLGPDQPVQLREELNVSKFEDNELNPSGKKDLPKGGSKKANDKRMDAIGKNVTGKTPKKGEKK